MSTRVLGTGGLLSAMLLLGSSASADGRNPGSLLIYPEYDSTPGRLTLLTVTNTNPDPQSGDIRVEIVFLNGAGAAPTLCTESNVTVTLTPNDTLTFVASALNPSFQQGYAYAFAKDVQGRAISFDWLIGDDLLLDGVNALDYAINPISFDGVPAQGQPTDVDQDGIRDLNGNEYEQAPAKMRVPRFIGQATPYQSSLILINLSGGKQFTSMLDFLVYNDNEEVFSANYTFKCWKKLPLSSISQSFSQDFLANFTSHAAGEIVGATQVESGWFEIDGNLAWSSSLEIQDPAFLAVLTERTASYAGAEVSFEMGKQANGDLLPLGPFGDSN